MVKKLTEEQLKLKITSLSYQFAGKLLLRNEIHLEEIIFQKLLSASAFTATPSIIKKRTTSECQRCGNKKQSLFASMPCSTCKGNVTYCRKCIIMGRVKQCEPLYYWSGIKPNWPEHKQPLTWSGQLTKAQQIAAAEITKNIEGKQSTELLIWAVTGSGKTEMLFPGIAKALQLGKRICIATPRADVVRELLPRLKEAFATISIQGLYGGSKDKDGSAQLIVGTTHQLIRYKHGFDVVIIDEIDAFPYHEDTSLPFVSRRAKRLNGNMIYLTATPRKDQQRKLVRKDLPHVFVPLRFHRNPLPVPRFKMCFSLKRDLSKDHPPQPFINWLQTRDRKDRQLLLFVPTIKLANQMKGQLAFHLERRGILLSSKKIKAVHSKDENREKYINLFRENKLSILITTTILERGVTFPSVDVAVLDAGHTVFDEAALVQIAGRAGRSPRDPSGEVVFYHDGKTNAMVQSVRSIITMNKRAGFK